MSDSTSIPQNGNGQEHEQVVSLKGMYKDYFLDYASYVILERAVPSIDDGLKPVQRRILHAMKEMDDGRYHKVANIIGQTMQYHPHGDAAIGDALVNLGQKDLMIDTQGNWGDNRTGDSAAAARYIEARLTKFALEVAFNPQTTEWQLSYDGRKREPINLPMKFPMLLAQGADGIAVGLSTKILPHNFIELVKASIKILEGKRVKIYPDFDMGGFIDVSDYNGGKRGGRVKVRARIEKVDKGTLAVRQLPYGETTSTLIDSIIKASDKKKIKIKRVVDNTAEHVEVAIELAPDVSPDVTIDALYAFTKCEVSISPNACVIIDDKPHFLTVEEILQHCTEHTRELLRQELEIEKAALEEKLHFASLEKIFIEKRIYHKIEQCETWEAVIETIDRELKKYVAGPSEKPKAGDTRLRLLRDVTEEDIVRLTEIKIKRISKFNSFKADELIAKLEEELAEVKHHLANLTAYAIAYFERLLEKYGKGKERKTQITTFDAIQAVQVVANNTKLYVDRKEGFIGWGLKKDEFVVDCSDIDDIITFFRDGTFRVDRIAEKTFVGKDIMHVDVWKKEDERTTYNLVYLDTKSGRSMAKRFNVTSITRATPYQLGKEKDGSKVLYFSANPNGEAEVVTVKLRQSAKAKNKIFDFDFGELAIKGRQAAGNILTRYPVLNITLKEVGKSTLGAMKIWMDEVSGRLNSDQRGLYLGGFDTGDQLLVIYRSGEYELLDLDLSKKFDVKELMHITKYVPDAVVNVVYFEGGKGWTMVKRFQIETSSTGQRFAFLSEHKGTKLLYASTEDGVQLQYSYRTKTGKEEGMLDISEFMDTKGWKALGNKLSEYKLTSIKELKDAEEEDKTAKTGPAPEPEEEEQAPEPEAKAMPEKKEQKKAPEAKAPTPEKPGKTAKKDAAPGNGKYKAGDSIDFDIENGQGKLFD